MRVVWYVLQQPWKVPYFSSLFFKVLTFGLRSHWFQVCLALFLTQAALFSDISKEQLLRAFVNLVFSTDGEEEQTLLNSDSDVDLTSLPSRTGSSKFLQKRCALIAVIVLPVAVSLITNNVLLLASLTGNYPGVGVQYIIPSLLVLYARRWVVV